MNSDNQPGVADPGQYAFAVLQPNVNNAVASTLTVLTTPFLNFLKLAAKYLYSCCTELSAPASVFEVIHHSYIVRVMVNFFENFCTSNHLSLAFPCGPVGIVAPSVISLSSVAQRICDLTSFGLRGLFFLKPNLLTRVLSYIFDTSSCAKSNETAGLRKSAAHDAFVMVPVNITSAIGLDC